eukprot:TRINITY_DN38523_c0_g1_i1.p1 TRINITY_DN38523_c0_g1~~TRINITY_DN38523_c0_g1_i1.p1  ORF type:complete len:561 (+),score=103.08 TRINITY_DN38523_c0_g1_i1:3-1685(+)
MSGRGSTRQRVRNRGGGRTGNAPHVGIHHKGSSTETRPPSTIHATPPTVASRGGRGRAAGPSRPVRKTTASSSSPSPPKPSGMGRSKGQLPLPVRAPSSHDESGRTTEKRLYRTKERLAPPVTEGEDEEDEDVEDCAIVLPFDENGARDSRRRGAWNVVDRATDLLQRLRIRAKETRMEVEWSGSRGLLDLQDALPLLRGESTIDKERLELMALAETTLEKGMALVHPSTTRSGKNSSERAEVQAAFGELAEKIRMVATTRTPALGEIVAVETVCGHEGDVYALAVYARRLFSVSWDETIKVWDLSATQRLQALLSLEGHTGTIHTCIAHEQALYTGGDDESVKVWDISLGQPVCRRTLLPKEGPIWSMVALGDWLICGFSSGSVIAYNLKSPLQTRTFNGNRAGIHALVVYDSVYLFSGSSDGSLLVWDMREDVCTPVHAVKEHRMALNALAIHKDHLFAASSDGFISVWKAKTYTLQRMLHGHTGGVVCLLVHKDHLFSGSTDRTVRVWNAQTLECFYVIQNIPFTVFSMAALQDRLFCGTGGKDDRAGSITVWRLNI